MAPACRPRRGRSPTSSAYHWDGIYHPQYRTTILAPDSLTRHVRRGGTTGELLKEVAVEKLNGDLIERKTFAWELVRKWQGDNVPGSGWYRDSVPTSVETTRDGRVYRREFEYDDDTAIGSTGHFGQPVQIVETGDFTRTTTLTYQTFTGSRWLADAVSQVTVDGIVTAAAEYDGNTGFATSRTALGVTTTFVPDVWGNVLRQTDANGHRTSFDTSGARCAQSTRPSTRRRSRSTRSAKQRRRPGAASRRNSRTTASGGRRACIRRLGTTP